MFTLSLAKQPPRASVYILVLVSRSWLLYSSSSQFFITIRQASPSSRSISRHILYFSSPSNLVSRTSRYRALHPPSRFENKEGDSSGQQCATLKSLGIFAAATAWPWSCGGVYSRYELAMNCGRDTWGSFNGGWVPGACPKCMEPTPPPTP